VTYNGLIPPPTNAGTFAVVATFTSANANYSGTIGDGNITIAQALPKLTLQVGTFSADGLPHPATLAAIGVDGRTPLGTATITYNGSPDAAVSARDVRGRRDVRQRRCELPQTQRQMEQSSLARRRVFFPLRPMPTSRAWRGSASRVASLVVVFDQAVQLDADALTLALHTNHVVFNGVAQPQASARCRRC